MTDDIKINVPVKNLDQHNHDVSAHFPPNSSYRENYWFEHAVQLCRRKSWDDDVV
jgi:hypothetical protein